jgi:hypothetical protein
MWEENDLNHYKTYVSKNRGQIYNDDFSKIIYKYASNDNLKTFLEIGTWNGLGSTKAFVDGFNNRSDNNYIFYSLECNKDKYMFANNLYSDNKNVHILNEVIWNIEPSNFYDIFPQCKTNTLYKKWNEVDLINMKKCKIFLERPELPKIFDVILLDGGEFTTYFEYQKLKNRCKYLLLDDINADKCKLIVDEIKQNPNDWEILNTSKTRNGFMVAKNIKNNI